MSVAPITLDGFSSKVVFVLIKIYFSSVVLQVLCFGPCPQYVVPYGSSLTFEKEVQLMILGVSHTFTMEVFDKTSMASLGDFPLAMFDCQSIHGSSLRFLG